MTPEREKELREKVAKDSQLATELSQKGFTVQNRYPIEMTELFILIDELRAINNHLLTRSVKDSNEFVRKQSIEQMALREKLTMAVEALEEVRNQACVCDGENAKLKYRWVIDRIQQALSKIRGENEKQGF
jgi:hypothetical protein